MKHDLEITVSKVIEHFRESIDDSTMRYSLIGASLYHAALASEQHSYISGEMDGKAKDIGSIAFKLQEVVARLKHEDATAILVELQSREVSPNIQRNRQWKRLADVFESITPNQETYRHIGEAVENRFFPMDLVRGAKRVRKHEPSYEHFLQRYNRSLEDGLSFSKEIYRRNIIRSRWVEEERLLRGAIIGCLHPE